MKPKLVLGRGKKYDEDLSESRFSLVCRNIFENPDVMHCTCCGKVIVFSYVVLGRDYCYPCCRIILNECIEALELYVIGGILK
jgi:hypothetical protein